MSSAYFCFNLPFVVFQSPLIFSLLAEGVLTTVVSPLGVSMTVFLAGDCGEGGQGGKQDQFHGKDG